MNVEKDSEQSGQPSTPLLPPSMKSSRLERHTLCPELEGEVERLVSKEQAAILLCFRAGPMR